VLVNTFYERHVEQLLDLAGRATAALSQAGIDYRVVGGLAIYVYVNAVDPMAARLTRDIDLAVNRRDLDGIREAVRPLGLVYRHTAGLDMLVDAREPSARRRIQLHPDNPESVPPLASSSAGEGGFLLAPLVDIVRMKLTGFRLKDQVHVQDLDAAGLITPQIEQQLSPVHRERLRQVRASR